MDLLFLFVCRVLRVFQLDTGDGPRSTDELIAEMRADPSQLAHERSLYETYWAGQGQADAERLIEIFMAAARYLSDVVEGPIPLLVNRDEAMTSVRLGDSPDGDAMRLGRAMQRSIQNQIERSTAGLSEPILAEIRRIVDDRPAIAVPTASRYLDTAAIAARLSLATKTVQRLCKRGEIDADKTAGKEWRTTEDRLKKSTYLNHRKHRGKARAEME